MHEMFSCQTEKEFLDCFKSLLEKIEPIDQIDLWVREVPFSAYRSVTKPTNQKIPLDENHSEQLISQVFLWDNRSQDYCMLETEDPNAPCIAALGTPFGQITGWFVIHFKNPHAANLQESSFLDLLLTASYAFERVQFVSVLKLLTNPSHLWGNSDQAVDLISLVSIYISQLSHQLKNPMTSIRGYSDLLTTGMMGDITSQQSKSLETIIFNLDRVNEGIIIPNSVFKLFANRLELLKKREDLSPIFNRICDQFQQTRARQSVKILTILPEVLEFETDSHYFEEALRGIIKTCIQFMEINQTCTVKSYLSGADLYVVLVFHVDLNQRIPVIRDFDQFISKQLQDGGFHEGYCLWKKSLLLWKFTGGEIVSAEITHQVLRLTLRCAA